MLTGKRDNFVEKVEIKEEINKVMEVTVNFETIILGIIYNN